MAPCTSEDNKSTPSVSPSSAKTQAQAMSPKVPRVGETSSGQPQVASNSSILPSPPDSQPTETTEISDNGHTDNLGSPLQLPPLPSSSIGSLLSDLSPSNVVSEQDIIAAENTKDITLPPPTQPHSVSGLTSNETSEQKSIAPTRQPVHRQAVCKSKTLVSVTALPLDDGEPGSQTAASRIADYQKELQVSLNHSSNQELMLSSQITSGSSHSGPETKNGVFRRRFRAGKRPEHHDSPPTTFHKIGQRIRANKCQSPETPALEGGNSADSTASSIPEQNIQPTSSIHQLQVEDAQVDPNLDTGSTLSTSIEDNKLASILQIGDSFSTTVFRSLDSIQDSTSSSSFSHSNGRCTTSFASSSPTIGSYATAPQQPIVDCPWNISAKNTAHQQPTDSSWGGDPAWTTSIQGTPCDIGSLSTKSSSKSLGQKGKKPVRVARFTEHLEEVVSRSSPKSGVFVSGTIPELTAAVTANEAPKDSDKPKKKSGWRKLFGFHLRDYETVEDPEPLADTLLCDVCKKGSRIPWKNPKGQKLTRTTTENLTTTTSLSRNRDSRRSSFHMNRAPAQPRGDASIGREAVSPVVITQSDERPQLRTVCSLPIINTSPLHIQIPRRAHSFPTLETIPEGGAIKFLDTLEKTVPQRRAVYFENYQDSDKRGTSFIEDYQDWEIVEEKRSGVVRRNSAPKILNDVAQSIPLQSAPERTESSYDAPESREDAIAAISVMDTLVFERPCIQRRKSDPNLFTPVAWAKTSRLQKDLPLVGRKHFYALLINDEITATDFASHSLRELLRGLPKTGHCWFQPYLAVPPPAAIAHAPGVGVSSLRPTCGEYLGPCTPDPSLYYMSGAAPAFVKSPNVSSGTPGFGTIGGAKHMDACIYAVPNLMSEQVHGMNWEPTLSPPAKIEHLVCICFYKHDEEEIKEATELKRESESDEHDGKKRRPKRKAQRERKAPSLKRQLQILWKSTTGNERWDTWSCKFSPCESGVLRR